MTFLQGSGNLRAAVVLPEGEDENEWIAVHGPFIPQLSSDCSAIDGEGHDDRSD